MIEELTEAEARSQIDTNVFGALWITQAALPLLRKQGGGHILQVSSIGGIIAVPNLGIYHASKWALEGLSQSLSYEGAPFGIKVTLIEPGGFATDWEAPPRNGPRPLRRTTSSGPRPTQSSAPCLHRQGQVTRAPPPTQSSPWSMLSSRPCDSSSVSTRSTSPRKRMRSGSLPGSIGKTRPSPHTAPN